LTSTSLGATFYSDAGNTPATSVTITSGSSTVSFWYNDTVAGSPTLTVSSAGLTSATTVFVISPASLDHFTITTVSSPQTAGVAFNISVTAVDHYGNTVTSYTGQNTLSDLSGTISPTATSSFSAGTWTGSLDITKAYSNDIITTFGSGKSGTTNQFSVESAALDHFTMSGYPSSVTTGQSFNITVTACDAFGNVVTGYTSQVYFTSSDAQAVLPYSSSSKYTFTSADNGSHTFTGFELNTLPSQTITVTDGVKSATSNAITVMLPVTPPTYSNISASSTVAGQACTFSSEWNDNYGLSGYIFYTNNTGVWMSTTWTAFSGTPSWANVTQTLNSNVGVVIGYYWYANNTNGLWTNTGIQTLTTTTTSSPVNTYFSIVSNSTVTQVAFNSTSEVLQFTVSGPSGTTGFTNVTIAKTIINDTSTLEVYLDGNPISYTVYDLTTSWLIYFTYHHSTHNVVMEFAPQQTKTPSTPSTSNTSSNAPTAAIIGLVAVTSATLAITIERKRKPRNPPKTKKLDEPVKRHISQGSAKAH
jgi:S-adenosylmethionine hydrolase